MDMGVEKQMAVRAIAVGINILLLLLWHVLHFIVSICYLALEIAYGLESYVISSGLVKKYSALDPRKVQYLVIVVDSEDASQTSRVIELLQWVVAIGVKRVCLYDMEGVLKKSKETIMQRLSQTKLSKEATNTDPLMDAMTLDFASFADGKEAAAKAASLLFTKYYLNGDQKKPITEPNMAEALETIGCGGPDPDLLLIYAPARCHQGFPAWRSRYTEFVHMGPLRCMKYGSLVKAIYRFTTVRQNYGT